NRAGASFVIKNKPHRSLATGMPRLIPAALHRPASALMIRCGGQTIAGDVLSRTLTTKLCLLVMLKGSTATQVTVAKPIGNKATEEVTAVARRLQTVERVIAVSAERLFPKRLPSRVKAHGPIVVAAEVGACLGAARARGR